MYTHSNGNTNFFMQIMFLNELNENYFYTNKKNILEITRGYMNLIRIKNR